MIKSYPVRIEAYDETKELLFVVEAFDEQCCTVDVKTVVTSESWLDISSQIHSSLVKIQNGY